MGRDHGRYALDLFCKGFCMVEEGWVFGLGLEGEAKENLTWGCVGTWDEGMKVLMGFV